MFSALTAISIATPLPEHLAWSILYAERKKRARTRYRNNIIASKYRHLDSLEIRVSKEMRRKQEKKARKRGRIGRRERETIQISNDAR